MAIAFARMEVGKRINQKNAVCKAAYNARESLYFEGNCVLEARSYDFSEREGLVYHKIHLPDGANPNFYHPEVLWNQAEKAEERKDSQVFFECVLALPDEASISLEERIAMTEKFCQEEFAKHGLIYQIDLHAPDTKVVFNAEDKEVVSSEHNWHAHITIATRRLKEDGSAFEEKKPRDLHKKLLKTPWGKVWAAFQNECFREWGKELSVDETGFFAQHHLGPQRMRSKSSYALVQENEKIKDLNREFAKEPALILEKLLERKSTFTKQEAERFIDKNVLQEKILETKKAFWEQGSLVQLFDKKRELASNRFTSRDVLDEEEKILRLCDRLNERKAFFLKGDTSFASQNLNNEQKLSFDFLTQGSGVSCIQGFAGTGKSYLLSALKNAYESSGYKTRAFAPDNFCVKELQSKGLDNAENIYRFLFQYKLGKRSVAKKEIWFLDEAAKISNSSLLELLKIAEKKKAQVFLSGDYAQLGSPERGGIFRFLSEKYPTVILQDIQRQKDEKDRAFVKNLAIGELGTALQQMQAQNAIEWTLSKKEAIEGIVLAWAKDTREQGGISTLIVAQSNADVHALNTAIHSLRKERGEVSKKEFVFQRTAGELRISLGDKIEFRGNDSSLGITNGDRGVLVEARENCLAVKTEKTVLRFDPKKYQQFDLGYATTNIRAQGAGVDHAYILHGAYSNIQALYVSVSRHFKKLNYFVPREEVSGFADLKWQAKRGERKEFSVEYTHQAAIAEKQKQQDLDEAIEEFKASDSLQDKYVAYAAGSWEWMKRKGKSYFQRVYDRLEDGHFYKKGFKMAREIRKQEGSFLGHVEEPVVLTHVLESIKGEEVKELGEPARVEEFSGMSEALEKSLCRYFDWVEKEKALHALVQHTSLAKQQQKSPYFAELLQTREQKSILAKDLFTQSSWELSQCLGKRGYERLLKDAHYEAKDRTLFTASELVLKDFQNFESERFEGLSDAEKKAVFAFEVASEKRVDAEWLKAFKEARADYVSICETMEAGNFAFKEVVAKEYESKEFMQFRERARAATELKDLADYNSQYYKDWQEACGKRNEAAYFLLRAKPQLKEKERVLLEDFASRHEKFLGRQKEGLSLERSLLEKVEPLLHTLFSDRPMKKTAKHFSFGSNGSLKVCIQGERAGSFYDHENKEGGGLVRLIQRELVKNPQEAREWARSFLKEDLMVPRHYAIPKKIQAEKQWISVPVDRDISAPRAFSSKRFVEEARYAYRDERGHLLGYIVRSRDTETGKKSVVPLSYGCYEGEKNCSWRFKMFHSNGLRSLYGLRELSQKPELPVLIVEGEKAADAAAKRLDALGESFVCVTWIGGSAAVSKSDWTPLKGREVYLWPDNDPAGFGAADDIYEVLVELGPKFLKQVDCSFLERKFPKKWDLADPLPAGLEEKDIKGFLYRAENRLCSLETTAYRMGLQNYKEAFAQEFANSLFALIDKRMRKTFEKQGLRAEDLRHELMEQCRMLYQDSLKQKQGIGQQHGLQGQLLDRVSMQVLWYKAEHGKDPSFRELAHMKQLIQKLAIDKDREKALSNTLQQTKDPLAQERRNFAINKGIKKALEASNSCSTQELQNIAKKESLIVAKELERQMQQNAILQKQLQIQKQQQRENSLER